MRKSGRTIVLGVALAALAVAPIAGAKPHEPKGHGHGGDHGSKAKGVSYVFKGTYVDATTVEVSKGNAHVRKGGLLGTVQFDFSTAKISVADTNGDGASDLADVLAGDRVVVKVKAPKGAPGEQPFAARQLVDQTSSEEPDDTEDEAPDVIEVPEDPAS